MIERPARKQFLQTQGNEDNSNDSYAVTASVIINNWTSEVNCFNEGLRVA
jgi:hypothetical protein